MNDRQDNWLIGHYFIYLLFYFIAIKKGSKRSITAKEQTIKYFIELIKRCVVYILFYQFKEGRGVNKITPITIVILI